MFSRTAHSFVLYFLDDFYFDINIFVNQNSLVMSTNFVISIFLFIFLCNLSLVMFANSFCFVIGIAFYAANVSTRIEYNCICHSLLCTDFTANFSPQIHNLSQEEGKTRNYCTFSSKGKSNSLEFKEEKNNIHLRKKR